MKIYEVDFEPIYPVGCHLIIKAKNIEEANEIAKTTLQSSGIYKFEVSEIKIKGSGVLSFTNGDY